MKSLPEIVKVVGQHLAIMALMAAIAGGVIELIVCAERMWK